MKNYKIMICLIFNIFVVGCAQSTNDVPENKIQQVVESKESPKVIYSKDFPQAAEHDWYLELLSKIKECVITSQSRVISNDLTIMIFIEMSIDGSIKNIPVVDTKGGSVEEQRFYSVKLVRAVQKCAPYDFLPKNKFDEWNRFSINFVPSEFFK